MSEITRRVKSKTIAADIDAEKTEPTDEFVDKKPNYKLPVRVLSRLVVISSLLVVIYFTSSDDMKVKVLARQSEVLVGKGQVVECSSSYINEVVKFGTCAPKECKRYISDKIISDKDATEVLKIAEKGLELGGSSGGASVLDLHSGALSMGEQFVNIYMRADAKNLFSSEDFNLYRVVKDKIKISLAHHFGIEPSTLHLTHPTFFSRITDKKAVTIHDEYWHSHVDKETYKSFHYTTLLYLNDYNIDFKGGRFVFVQGNTNHTVEPRKGRVLMFTSGAENLHHVEKVTSGIRYALTISFTCDVNHAIDDPSTNKFDV